MNTCSLRPTGIYGEGHELLKDFYKLGVERGGLIIGGIPDNIEHGRVYAGESIINQPSHTFRHVRKLVECSAGIQTNPGKSLTLRASQPDRKGEPDENHVATSSADCRKS